MDFHTRISRRVAAWRASSVSPGPRGQRPHQQPVGRGEEAGDPAHHLMQKGRAGARQAGDDDRRAQRRIVDLGVRAPVLLEQQAVDERVLDVLAHEDAADEMEVGIVLERLHQVPEAFAIIGVAEVLEPHGPAGGGLQRVRIEADRLPAEGSGGALERAGGAEGGGADQVAVEPVAHVSPRCGRNRRP
jgi:hypothetical protein